MSLNTGIGPRTAVVTGAGSLTGIGFHTATRFAQEGWAVALIDVNAGGLEQAATGVLDQVPGAQVATFVLDVTDAEAVAAVAAAVAASDLPPVGTLCNIAGIPSPAAFLDTSLVEWDRVLAVNLTGPFLLSQAFVPQMIEGGYGRVVNMSSVTAQHGGGVFSKTSYAAAKAGVLGLTRGMARELAEHGITVNAVAPGVVDTDIRVGSDEETERALAAAVPLKRQARPQEIAALFVWLSCEDSAYITGITHSINGGSYIA
ncbi:short-chain dehydrogenase [Terrabacter sp. 28]|nr:short-chain dehydrogenase [Terrabacter sp. 28]